MSGSFPLPLNNYDIGYNFNALFNSALRLDCFTTETYCEKMKLKQLVRMKETFLN